MTTLPNSTPYYGGGQVKNPADVVTHASAPSAADTAHNVGTIYVNTADQSAYILVGKTGGTADWEAIGGAGAAVATINTLSPTGGNITIAGTSNEIDIANAGSTVTLSIPAIFAAPGTIAAASTIEAGTGIAAITGNISAVAGNVSASGTVTAGTGITATTGNIAASSGNLSASGTVTAGTGVTATTGNITATNGNIVLGTAGNKQVYTSIASGDAAGANSAGKVTLVGGTATVSTTAVGASSVFRLTRQDIGSTGAAALGLLTIGTVTAGASFVINAVQAADATALQASDVSVIFWEIVN